MTIYSNSYVSGQVIHQFNREGSRFIGKSNKLFFLYYEKKPDSDSLNTLIVKPIILKGNLLFDIEQKDSYNFTTYFYETSLRFSLTIDSKFIFNNKEILNRYKLSKYFSDGNKYISTCFYNDILYINSSFAVGNYGGIEGLFFINANDAQPSLNLLPVKAYNPFIQGSYLYYTIDYVSVKYSDYPKSLYRVKIGDWYHPELIADDIYYVAPYYADTSYIFIQDSRKEPDGKLGIKNILFNPHTKKYNYFDGKNSIPFTDHGVQYMLGSCKDPTSKKFYYCLESPNKFNVELPFTWINVSPPNENWLHIPYIHKPFTNTFLKDEDIFFATSDRLKTYSKAELRIMRNTFYAREGYEFENKELQTFFNQFEWYKKTVAMRKIQRIKNEDIVLAEMDKERIKLIKEVEDSK